MYNKLKEEYTEVYNSFFDDKTNKYGCGINNLNAINPERDNKCNDLKAQVENLLKIEEAFQAYDWGNMEDNKNDHLKNCNFIITNVNRFLTNRLAPAFRITP